MPHPYTTDSEERRHIPFILAVIAILAAFGISYALKKVTIELPTWVDGPSTMALYGLFYGGFKKWLWRIPLLHRVGLVRVPRLYGDWSGHVMTSFDGHNEKHKVEVSIVQDWTHMLVCLRSAHSKSRSTVASLLVCDGIQLAHEYENEPSPSAAGTMHSHRGYVRLELSENGLSLKGDYFSGRDRQSIGTVTLERVRRKTRSSAH
jgi:SMODS-associating 2TM, beta-strand rich effector domain